MDTKKLLAPILGSVLLVVRASGDEPPRASPSDASLKSSVQRLRAGESLERGYLGVQGQEADPLGIRITAVLEKSPAEAAGLRVGDVIVAVDEQPVKGFDDLAARIEGAKPGTELRFTVRRDANELTIKATLGERKVDVDALWRSRRPQRLPVAPDHFDPHILRWTWPIPSEPDGVLLGVKTQPLSEPLAKSLGLPSTDGALVNEVMHDSAADRAGLRASDVIVALNGNAVKSPQELHEQIKKAGPGAKVLIEINRDGKRTTLDATLAIAPAFRGPAPLIAPFFDASGARIEALEKRVRELERRLEELEKRLPTQAKDK